MSSDRQLQFLMFNCERGWLLPTNTMFTEHHTRYTNIRLPEWFSLSVIYMYIHAIMYCSRLFVVVFQEMNC